MIEQAFIPNVSDEEIERMKIYYQNLNTDPDIIIYQNFNWTLLKRDMDFLIKNNIISESMKQYIFHFLKSMDEDFGVLEYKALRSFDLRTSNNKLNLILVDKLTYSKSEFSRSINIFVDKSIYSCIIIDQKSKKITIFNELNNFDVSDQLVQQLLKFDKLNENFEQKYFILKRFVKNSESNKFLFFSLLFQCFNKNIVLNEENLEYYCKFLKDCLIYFAVSNYKLTERKKTLSKRKSNDVYEEASIQKQNIPPQLFNYDDDKNILDYEITDSFFDLGASQIGERKFKIKRKSFITSKNDSDLKIIPENSKSRHNEHLIHRKSSFAEENETKSKRKNGSYNSFDEEMRKPEKTLSHEKHREGKVLSKLMIEVNKYNNLVKNNKEKLKQINTYNHLFTLISNVKEINENTQKVLKLINGKVHISNRNSLYRRKDVIGRMETEPINEISGSFNVRSLRNSNEEDGIHFRKKLSNFLGQGDSNKITIRDNSPFAKGLIRFNSFSNRNNLSQERPSPSSNVKFPKI